MYQGSSWSNWIIDGGAICWNGDNQRRDQSLVERLWIVGARNIPKYSINYLFSLSLVIIDILVKNSYGEGSGNPLQYSCLENPMDGGAWLAAVHGVAKSRARLSDFTFTFHFHALEKEMATHSSILAWRIPGTEEPSGLLSLGSHRVGHDWSDLAAAAAKNSYNHICTGN